MGLRKYFEFIRFSHTVFALPFALGSMFVAIKHQQLVGMWTGWEKFSPTLLLILTAMVCARTAAMGFNRIVDRKLDAQNPRTARRHLPTQQISATRAWGLVVVATAGFVASAYFINGICLYLSPVALAVIFLYSFTKRFTEFCHFILGLALSLSVLGAWLAVTGTWAVSPIILALAVILWVAGFDIIYAIQDMEFDRAQGLHSIPARVGVPHALNLARVCHVAMAVLLFIFGWISGLNVPYFGGLVIIFTSLAVEHWLAARRDTKWLEAAFFRVNALISVVFLIAVVVGTDPYLLWPQEWWIKHGRFR